MLKVWGRANSINVRKVLWVADEIGIPYEREDWGRGFRPVDTPEFKAINPVAVIPVIEDDGFRLRESNTIVRYLAAKHGRTDLYPADLKARATVEAWMDWCSTEVLTGARPVFFGLFVKNPAFVDPKIIAAGALEWNRQMQVLEDTLAGGQPFVTGHSFTIADIPVGLFVNRWSALEFDKPRLPAVAAYYDRLAKRPAYRTHGRNGHP